QANQVKEATQGFRFMGQRFTIDGYWLQQLTNPYVNNRFMPAGLDIPAVFGSDTAHALALEAGAKKFPDYEKQVKVLVSQTDGIAPENWQESLYSSWLYALQPLWKRDPKLYPPMMGSDPWLKKDVQVGLGSLAQLKHDTLLYIKQPVMVPVMGAFSNYKVGYV